jgi:hypothetical protein
LDLNIGLADAPFQALGETNTRQAGDNKRTMKVISLIYNQICK